MLRKYAFDLVFQNAAERLAYTPVPGDFDKVAMQVDDESYWVAMPGDPILWAPLGTPVLMVADHGVTCDGVTNDGPALQSLLDRLGPGEQTLVFLSECLTNQNLTFPVSVFLVFLRNTSPTPFTGTGVVTINSSMLQVSPTRIALRSNGAAEFKLQSPDGNGLTISTEGGPTGISVLNMYSAGGATFGVTANGTGALDISASNGSDLPSAPVGFGSVNGVVFAALGTTGQDRHQLIAGISWHTANVTGQTISANNSISVQVTNTGVQPTQACDVAIPDNMPAGLLVQARTYQSDVYLHIFNVTGAPIVVPAMTFEILTFLRNTA
jgi:hypothetical protein